MINTFDILSDFKTFYQYTMETNTCDYFDKNIRKKYVTEPWVDCNTYFLGLTKDKGLEKELNRQIVELPFLIEAMAAIIDDPTAAISWIPSYGAACPGSPFDALTMSPEVQHRLFCVFFSEPLIKFKAVQYDFIRPMLRDIRDYLQQLVSNSDASSNSLLVTLVWISSLADVAFFVILILLFVLPHMLQVMWLGLFDSARS